MPLIIYKNSLRHCKSLTAPSTLICFDKYNYVVMIVKTRCRLFPSGYKIASHYYVVNLPTPSRSPRLSLHIRHTHTLIIIYLFICVFI